LNTDPNPDHLNPDSNHDQVFLLNLDPCPNPGFGFKNKICFTFFLQVPGEATSNTERASSSTQSTKKQEAGSSIQKVMPDSSQIGGQKDAKIN
jgi:hypothetical protein